MPAQHARFGGTQRFIPRWRRQAPAVPLDPQLALLRRWQSQRLARTHHDLLHSPRYGRGSRFFLSDVYGAKDFSQRDQDLMHVYTAMRCVLPRQIVHTLEQIIALNNMTVALDDALLRALIDELGMTTYLTTAMYAAAYRICDNYDARLAQIDLLIAVGRQIDELVRMAYIELILRLARKPACWAGWEELQAFLEEGYFAFKEMQGADYFLATIEQREKQILNQIFAASPQPLAI